MKKTPRAGVVLLSLALLAAGTFLLLHSHWVAQGIRAYSRFDRSHIQNLKGQPATHPSSRSLFLDVDPFLWNHYALRVARGETLRVRWTKVDNHPFGREVHWFSGLTWVLAASGHLRRAITGEDLQTALERASLAVNPLFMMALLLGSAVLIRRRVDWQAAVVVVLAVGGSRNFITAFSAGGPDHHGLAMAAAFGTLLGILMGGCGWTRAETGTEAACPTPDAARRWFLFSALSASAGMWVSAFSQIFAFATVAAGFILLLAVGPPATADPGVSYQPKLWRLWGRCGALASLAFYLLEYFPGAISLRLEVNHPLYALAWWGASECMAEIAERRFGAEGAAPRALSVVRTALAAMALLSPVLVLLGKGAQVYIPFDPFLRRLHEQIFEFQPSQLLPFLQTFSLPLLAGVLVVLRSVLCRPRREDIAPVAFALGSALVSIAMVSWQVRWIFLATQSLVVLVLAGMLTPSRSAVLHCRRGVLASALAVLFAAQFALTSVTTLKGDHNRKKLASPDIALSSFLVARNVADVLRADSGPGTVVALSWGWPGTIMALEADIKGLSSYYWENRDGLEAAAEIFLAQTDQEALRLLRERDITHIVIFRGSFSPSRLFYTRYGSDDPDALSRTLGARIIGGKAPPWLLPVPYTPLIDNLKESYLFQAFIFRVLS